MKKRLIAIVTLIAVCAMTLGLLTACGSSEPLTDVFYFQNDCGEQMDGFYVSSLSADTWGDALNYAAVSKGGQIHIDNSKLVDGVGATYDIGAIDHSAMNYEFYEVPVNDGDILAIGPASGDTATLTVTGADGSVTTYEGYAYVSEE